MPFDMIWGAPATSSSNMMFTAGIESVDYRANYPHLTDLEVWRGTTNVFAQATLIRTIVARPDGQVETYTDTGLTADQNYYYYYRYVRTISSGKKFYGTPYLRTMKPRAPLPPEESVTTLMLAPEAVTSRITAETIGTWCHGGTAPDGTVLPESDKSTFLIGFDFAGDGSTMIVEVIVQQAEAFPYFRTGGQVAAFIKCDIVDATTNPGTEEMIASAELHVMAHHLQQFPIAPTQWVNTPFSRDFHHKFIINTVPNKPYTLFLDQRVFLDDNSNYFLYRSGNIKILWEIFKR